MGRLQGKVALITGAARGIGRETAKRFLEEGAQVVISDRDGALVAEVADEMGSHCRGIEQDVCDPRGWQDVMASIQAQEGHLDILVNNAGILATQSRQNFEDTDLEQWRKVNAINVEGVFLGCQAALKVMGDGGSIVNLSSIAGIVGTARLVAYGASKAAVRQMTKSVIDHCKAKGLLVRCNSLHPGPIVTDMGQQLMELNDADPDVNWAGYNAKVPLGYPGEAVDVANCILFLASDEARYVNGAELIVDGGRSAL